jgi:hypothetical protein
MKLVFTVGSDQPRRGGGVLAVMKYGVVGVLALLAMNRGDIRRYLRLRRM